MGVNGSHPWTAWWTTPPHRRPLRPRPAPHRPAAACSPRPSTGPPRTPGSAPRARHHACSRCRQCFRSHGGAGSTVAGRGRRALPSPHAAEHRRLRMPLGAGHSRTPCTADFACRWAPCTAEHRAPCAPCAPGWPPVPPPLPPFRKALTLPWCAAKVHGAKALTRVGGHARSWRAAPVGWGDPQWTRVRPPRRGEGGVDRRPAPGRPSARRTGGRALFRGAPGRGPAPLRRGAPGRAGARAAARPGPAAPPRAHCPGAPPAPTARTAPP